MDSSPQTFNSEANVGASLPLRDGKFLIGDFTIQASFQDTESSHIEISQLLVSINGSSGVGMPFVQESPTLWKYEGALVCQMSNSMDWDIKLFPQTLKGDNLGAVHIKPAEVYDVVSRARIHGNQELKREITVENGLLTLTLDVDIVIDGDNRPAKDDLVSIDARYLAKNGTIHTLTNGYTSLGKTAEIDDWISFLQETILVISRHNIFLTHLTMHLGLAYEYRFKSRGDISSIDKAIETQEHVVKLANRQMQASMRQRLARMVLLRFQTTHVIEDVDTAVTAARSAFEYAPGNTQSFIDCSQTLIAALNTRFKTLGEIRDLDDIISATTQVLEVVQNDVGSTTYVLRSLVSLYDSRQARTQDLAAVDQAILYQKRLVDLTTEDDISFLTHLSWLHNFYTLRIRRAPTPDLLNEAIPHARRLIERYPQQETLPSELHLYRRHLADFLHQQFKMGTGFMIDLDEAISIHRTDLETEVGKQQPSLPMQLLSLANCLETRHQTTHGVSDIEDAIRHGRYAVSLISPDDPKLPSALTSLGQYLFKGIVRTEKEEYYHEAVSVCWRALQLAPYGTPNHVQYTHNYAMALSGRYEFSSNISDIKAAIELEKKALIGVPESEPKLPRYNDSVASWFLLLYGHSQDLAHLNEAISLQQTSISLLPAGDGQRPFCLNNLGLSYQRRFMVTGERVDFEEAVSVFRKLIAETPPGDPELVGRWNNLAATIYHDYSEYSGNIEVLDQAIDAMRHCIEACREDEPFYPAALSNLAGILQDRMDRQGDSPLAAIDEVISYHQKALAILSQGHSYRPAIHRNLGAAFTRRYKISKLVSDLELGVASFKEAIKLLPEGHSDCPHVWLALGTSAKNLWELENDKEMLKTAVDYFRLAATATTGKPLIRVKGSREWARHAQSLYGSSEVLRAWDIAIGLLARVADLEMTLQTRHHRLSATSQISLEAASSALLLQRPDKALEYLERGRCLVWAQLNSLRQPIDELRDLDPALAEKILRVSHDLEQAGSRTASNLRIESDLQGKINDQAHVSHHVQLAREWAELLSTVRELQGFEDFLRPASCSTLMSHLPKSGVIVAVVVADSQCDAIALRPGSDTPLQIPLPNFSLRKAEKLRESLRTRLSSSGLRMREAVFDDTNEESEAEGRAIRPRFKAKAEDNILSQILRDLWSSVVEPIFNALQLKKSTGIPENRIWWCTTGPLAFLPIHAAGIYDRGLDSVSASDYAVSSYAPTVSAITDRVQRPINFGLESKGLFLVAQPEVKGLARIPGTIKETQIISSLMSENGVRSLCLQNEAATVDTTLENMAKYSCIHFACHAVQDTAEAMDSGFFMFDDRLSLATITKSNLSISDLAFLSACQTSTGNESYSEEAVHLAAGMLAAGYRGVVATMWSIEDKHAPQLAEDFYRYLLGGCATNLERADLDGKKDSGNIIEGTRAAYALHYSTQKLRKALDDSELSLLAWVPYVHFGM